MKETNREAQKRFLLVLATVFVFLALGAGYGLLVRKTGRALPCLFYRTTGLYCPACGATRMFLALFSGELALAARQNLLFFCIIPAALPILIYEAVRYVTYGRVPMKKWETVSFFVFLALLLLFAVLRNLPLFSFLSPI